MSSSPTTKRLRLPIPSQKLLNELRQGTEQHKKNNPNFYEEPEKLSETLQQRIKDRMNHAKMLIKQLKVRKQPSNIPENAEAQVVQCTEILQKYVDNTVTEGGGNNYKSSKRRFNRTRHRFNRTRHRFNRTRHRFNRTRHHY